MDIDYFDVLVRRAEVKRAAKSDCYFFFFSEKVTLKISFTSLVGYTSSPVLTKWESDSAVLLFPMKSQAV